MRRPGPRMAMHDTAVWLTGTGGPGYLVKGRTCMTTHAFLLLSHDKLWSWRLVSILMSLIFLLGGCSIVRRSSNEPPPLIKAVSKGDTPTTRALLAKGADVQARDANGRTALMNAAKNGNPTALQPLLTKGADVNADTGKAGQALI